ncbi:MAG: hypothetical protein ACE5KA_07070 [Nitrososphaerales archaeon]
MIHLKAVRQAKGSARQENWPICEYLLRELDKNRVPEFCEGYANAMID